MTLATGTRLGPYEIVGALGAGGMGEVYRARDTRLERTVAVKVLPGHLSASDEVKQRFEREAKVISSLSHPHICTLFDVGHHEGTDFLVMECLEGETLAARLQKGALPMEQVLHLGIQIADALDRAHRSGVVHRDLKPGNVMLTREGVKLLDFGLAKQAVAGAGTGDTVSLAQLATTPPDGDAITREGTILGTFQYMAPEQIEGGETDPRSDIFALGAVLYEMATGQRAFSGKTPASLIGAIMHARPEPVSRLAPLSAPAFERVVETCLAKDPEQRWRSAHDVRLQLQWIAEGGSQVGAPAGAPRRRRDRAAWIAAAACAAGMGAFAALWAGRAPEPQRVIRFEIPAPRGLREMGPPRLSPDGRHLAFDATGEDGQHRIWLRSLDATSARPLPGTEGVPGRPFWSPDSQHLAFMADGRLKRIPVSGGEPLVIASAPDGWDGTWGEGGMILYDDDPTGAILGVSAAGGVPAPVVSRPEGARAVGWPQFLPGGRRFLYVALAEPTAIMLGSLDGNAPVRVLSGHSRAEFAPPHHLLYVRERTLVAQRFDPNTGALRGDPLPVAQDVPVGSNALARFSASHEGTLAFRGVATNGARVVRVDREGQPGGTVVEPSSIVDMALSPDGRWLVLEMEEAGERELWLRDLTRGVSSRLAAIGTGEASTVWSPDGSSLVYTTTRADQSRILRRALDGEGGEETLLDGPGFASSWSADGHLLYDAQTPETRWDMWMLDVGGDAAPRLLVQSPGIDGRGQFSPDGRWIAYQSSESGRAEIYVRPLAGPGRTWQISTAGGERPQWRRDGTELYYLSPQDELVRVPVRTGATFESGAPEVLFVSRRLGVLTPYQVSPIGEPFLFLYPPDDEEPPLATIVVNWTTELARR